MMHRVASLGAGLALLVIAMSGCFTQPEDGVFGPANSLGGAENDSPALSLKASPARGPGPLEVEFSLSALDRDGGALTWSLDFGDRTAPAAGSDLPGRPRHTYTAPGAYVATFKVVSGDGDGAESFVSSITIVVLEGLVSDSEPTQGPEEAPEEAPEYSPPSGGGGGGGGGGSAGPSTSATSTSAAPDNQTASETSTSTAPPGNGSSSTSASSTSEGTSTSSSTSSTEQPTSSESGSQSATDSDTQTASSTGTETFSDPGTSTSESSTSSEPEPTPTGSESGTSSDPPL